MVFSNAAGNDREPPIPDAVVHAVRNALVQNAASVAECLLGAPNKNTLRKHVWRWGGKGGMRVFVSGERAGACADFRDGWKGDFIALIRRELHLEFRGAVKWAGNFVGIDVDADLTPETEEAKQAREAEAARRRAEREAAQDADETRRIAAAQRLWNSSTAVTGTAAETYLTITRAIPRPATGWPDAVRFHPGSRSLIVAGTNADGAVRFVQRVRLTTEGRKIDGAGELHVKETSGVMAGAFMRLPGAAGAPLLFAEGPETGISLWGSTGYETRLSIGSITRHEPPIGRRVVVCRDDSKPPKPEDAAKGKRSPDELFDAAVSKWLKTGADIVVATPWVERRRDESDFNDTIRAGGVDAVRARVEAALGRPPAIVRVPVEEGRARTLAAVARFYQQLREYDARRQHAEAAAKAELTKEAEANLEPDIIEWRKALDAARTASLKARRLAAVRPVTDESRAAAIAARDAARAARTWSIEASHAAAESKAGFRKTQVGIRSCAKATGRKEAGAYPVHGIRVDVGTGKSHANLKEIVKLIRELRAAGDKRAIVVAIPAHTLGDQQATRLANDANAAGISAGVWRSRKAPDPNHRDYQDTAIEKVSKTQMCRDIDAVKDAEEALATVQTAVCRNPKTKQQCAHFDECPFQKQKDARHDVWFVAHEILFSGKPAEIGDIAAVVVDESAWQDGLFGGPGANFLWISTLTSESVTVPDEPLSTEQLRTTRCALAEALAKMEIIPGESDPRSPVLKSAILACGIDAASANAAYTLEWRRKIEADIHPGMPPFDRKEAVQAVAHNKRVAKLGSLWKAVAHLVDDNGPERSGWISLGMVEQKDGIAPAIHIKGRKDVHESWHVPTMILDGTMQTDVVLRVWPTMELTADIHVLTPHQHITQVCDRSYALSQLRRDSGFRDVHAILCRQARQYAPRPVLAVVQIEIEEKLREVGNLPLNLKLAHHNNIAGRDEWGDVASLVVVGRTEPSPRAAEWQAEAITGIAIDPLPGYYEKAPAWREMSDGTFRRAEAARHPDPIAEAIRWHIAVGELIQIVGRPRGVNRTEANPVDVLILTDVPLPLPVEALIRAENVEASPDDIMMAAGGACLSGPAEAADAYPALWGKHSGEGKDREKASATRKAAQQAFAAWRDRGENKNAFLASNANRVSYYDWMPEGEICSHLRTIEYQATGKGREPTLVCYDPACVPDIAAWLAERVGPLAWCGQKPEPKETRLNALEEMAALGLVIGGTHAFLLHEGLFPSAPAARMEVARATKGQDISELPCTQPLLWRVRYQLAGAGAKAARAFANFTRFLTLRSELESKIAPVASITVDRPDDWQQSAIFCGYFAREDHRLSRERTIELIKEVLVVRDDGDADLSAEAIQFLDDLAAGMGAYNAANPVEGCVEAAIKKYREHSRGAGGAADASAFEPKNRRQ